MYVRLIGVGVDVGVRGCLFVCVLAQCWADDLIRTFVSCFFCVGLNIQI